MFCLFGKKMKQIIKKEQQKIRRATICKKQTGESLSLADGKCPHRRDLHAFGEGASDERGGDGGEHEVEGDEDAGWEVASAAEDGDAAQTAVMKGAEEGVEVVVARLHVDA